ncbi:MAG: hypothetical protein IKG44_08375 [Mogibacterium sp.]|nr:hypothetical protein [Mogibacterium sp.]
MKNEKGLTIFYERIEPIMYLYEDDKAAFGRIMYALFDYSINGVVADLENKQEESCLRLLKGMVDVNRDSLRKKNLTQSINAALRYAADEDDMRKRLIQAGFNDVEVQEGVDRYLERESRQLNEVRKEVAKKKEYEEELQNYYREFAGIGK